jgi:predicted nucleic acid-binding protein
MVVVVTPALILPTIAQGPADDQVLATALGAQANLIVSGDRHFDSLGGQFLGIPIVSPAKAVAIIGLP